MTEQKKTKKWGRTALIALAACAALIGSAGAVNAVTAGEFWGHLSDLIQVNAFKSVAVSPEGETFTMIDMTAEIEERDGRTILVVPGDEVDITDELIENGAYHYERTDNGSVCEVDVTGTPENWTMRSTVYDEGEEPGLVAVKTSEDENIALEGVGGEALEGGEEVQFSVSNFGVESECTAEKKVGVFMIEDE